MNVCISRTARIFGGAFSCLLLALFLQSPVLANTSTDINQFDIIKARSSYSHWTTKGCTDDDDIDDGCFVEVTADSDLRDFISDLRDGTETPSDASGYDLTEYDEVWKYLFEQKFCSSLSNRDSYSELNEDFNDCWEEGDSDGAAEVEWPQVDTNSEYFEASGFCKAGDTVCGISITICYNADECDGRSSNDDEFEEDDGEKAEFFDDNESCLFDTSRNEFTQCVNRGLKRVYDFLQGRGRYSYSALEDELEDQGVEIDSYSRSTSRVRDTSYFGAYGPVVPRPQRAPYVPVLTGPAPVQGPGGRYIVASLTQYLEAQPYASVCSTTQGCVNVIGASRFFQSYLGNLFVRITDYSVLQCMANRGYARSGGYEVDFGNTDLAACDRRMARATSLCPAPGTGAKSELLTMYNLGMLSSLVSPSLAHSMQNELNAAANTTPGCLCSAGFRNSDVLTSTSNTGDPWAAGAQVSSARICY